LKSLTVVFPEAQRCDVIEEEIGDPGPGEILVQTTVSLISTGTESWCYRGDFEPGTGWAAWVKYPFYPGYSHVGQVVKVGRQVREFAEGDRVFSVTSHRQFATKVAEPGEPVKVPDYIDDEEAAWLMLATITQTGVRRAEHNMGDRAVVIGLGPLGQLVTQYLRTIGLLEILVIDTIQQRLDIALAHGATHGFCGSAADAYDFVAQHTNEQMADVVYDVTGHYAVLPMGLKLARNFGKLVLMGDSPHPSRQHLTQDVLSRQVDIIGTQNQNLPPSQAQRWPFDQQALLFMEYLRREQMRVSDLITHRFSPTEAPAVYELLQNSRGSTMGVIFDWRQI